jgi:hypothetical protein
MFKKTLLCAALVAVSGGAVAKATGTATTLIQSTEGSMGITSIPTAAVTYALGASYTQGDTVTLTWSQPMAAGVGHSALAIEDAEVHTEVINNVFVAAMDATADLTVTDHLGQTVTIGQTQVAAATTVDGLATLINDATGTFGMTASGTDSGGLVLTADAGRAGSQTATIGPDANYTGTITFDEVSSTSIPLTVLSNTASSVTYRAGAVPAAFNSGNAMGIVTDAKNILGSGQADGTVVTQTYTAATSTGVAIDTGTVAVKVAEFHDQYMLVATKTSKQVDVENGRKQYTGAGSARFNDTVGIAISADTAYNTRVGAAGTVAGTMVASLNGAGATASIAKVNGNYSWLDKVSTAAYDIDATIGTISPAFATATHKADSVTIAPITLGTAVSVDTTTAATVILPTGAYSVDVTAKFTNQAGAQKSKVFGNTSLGAWTLNGQTITAYGIPNQAAVTPFLWVQNAGASVGEISGTASCDGATIQLGSLGSAAGDTNTSVGAAVQAAVDAAGTCAVGSRYDATLTVNAKSTDITITSGYKVTAADGSNDRLGLETSDSLN